MRWLGMIAALLMALASGAAHAGADVHYDVRASIGADGVVDADVRIRLSAAAAGKGKAFLLSRRFTVASVTGGKDATLMIKPIESPIEEASRYDFTFARPGARELRFRYRGPLNTKYDSGVPAFRPDQIELFLDHLWIPLGADIQTMFTADAQIDGLAPDMVVVGQGKVTRTKTGVRIHRTLLDVDLPMVAMAGFNRASAPGIEVYGRDLTTPISQLYLKHGAAASTFFRDWFGPLPDPDPIRVVQVSRERRLGYTRTAYTVVNDVGRATAAGDGGLGTARHIAHEIAHAWWRSASPITDDFWLVESTAEYCANRYVEFAMGADKAAELREAMRDSAEKAGPVMGHGRPSRAQLYNRGPLLLFALEQRIGRAKMDALMVEISRKTPNTAVQFFAALRATAGDAQADWFQAALLSEKLEK